LLIVGGFGYGGKLDLSAVWPIGWQRFVNEDPYFVPIRFAAADYGIGPLISKRSSTSSGGF
jgi:hypothetical protein